MMAGESMSDNIKFKVALKEKYLTMMNTNQPRQPSKINKVLLISKFVNCSHITLLGFKVATVLMQ